MLAVVLNSVAEIRERISLKMEQRQERKKCFCFYVIASIAETSVHVSLAQETCRETHMVRPGNMNHRLPAAATAVPSAEQRRERERREAVQSDRRGRLHQRHITSYPSSVAFDHFDWNYCCRRSVTRDLRDHTDS